MAQVLIRDLDDRVVARLKALARANGRSLEAELRSVVEQAAARDERLEATRDLAAKLRRRLAAAGRKHTDGAALVAEDRRR